VLLHYFEWGQGQAAPPAGFGHCIPHSPLQGTWAGQQGEGRAKVWAAEGCCKGMCVREGAGSTWGCVALANTHFGANLRNEAAQCCAQGGNSATQPKDCRPAPAYGLGTKSLASHREPLGLPSICQDQGIWEWFWVVLK